MGYGPVLWWCLICACVFCCVCRSAPPEQGGELFELSIIHFNDFHARFEPTNWESGACPRGKEDTCVGGIARLYTAVTDLKAQRPNAIVLNAGDNFQGTLWYSVHKWRAVLDFMNRLPHDVMTLGNHEFDDGIAGVLPYLKGLNCPVVAANINATEEPQLIGTFGPSVVLERGGRKIGIIGYVAQDFPDISNTEKLHFTEEIPAVAAEAAKLKAKGVDIIMALSHAGLGVDEQVARAVPDLDIIVGGHSHTLLYTGTPPGGDVAEDSYPVLVRQDNGRRVLVVQAYAFSKYVGNLTVRFNTDGELDSWEGNPLLMGQSVQQDPGILEAMQPWKKAIDDIAFKQVGTTKVYLNATGRACGRGECNLGNLLTDAMVEEYVRHSGPNSWTAAAIAITNSGGIRASIEETNNGVITFSDLMTAQPFGNTIDTLELQGKYVLQVLEQSVSNPFNKRNKRSTPQQFSGFGFLQVSGIQVSYDLTRSVGNRITTLKIRCNECRVPKYEPLEPEKWYRIALISFLVKGGDKYNVIRDNYRNRTTGRLDTDVFMDYLRIHDPITQGLEGRIQITE